MKKNRGPLKGGSEAPKKVCVPPPPSLSCPTPCPSLGGGWGLSLGQHKNFCYDSLCCYVGDCVVRHCHLYPSYSWQGISLTFAEMELDSIAMFTPGTNVMFIRFRGEPVLPQVIGYSKHGEQCRTVRRIDCDCSSAVRARQGVETKHQGLVPN